MSRLLGRVALLLGCALGCALGCTRNGDGLEPARLPAAVQGDYALFARRCSKCHSLARPLQSGIDDDEWWGLYVDRMRVMPGSGISTEDEVKILRFLRYYSAERRKKAGR